MIRALCTILFLIISGLGYAQNINISFTVKLVPDSHKIDGILDDLAWEEAEGAKNFQKYFPSEIVLAEPITI